MSSLAGSYLVGVVIVVCRLFSVSRCKKFLVGLRRRLIFKSPCMVMVVVGFLV